MSPAIGTLQFVFRIHKVGFFRCLEHVEQFIRSIPGHMAMEDDALCFLEYVARGLDSSFVV